ncbi:succinyldiaminopimelate transaminase [Brachybacterium sp. EF45031]|uniref:succinyldiaminopimelate transaminase n=1 Tax=Brachybacterium sillae TaxID=2810536 RepID=UPI00217E02BC|nr:succinyldiaminopimelate transaminase [Brachybacterium sillae]MCS6712428.1 succinyldiaminopimelate transaminase [Brachybacterium sillae]
MARRPLADRLPAFPWDSLAQARTLAESHPGGIVDLSVGTPVNPTPEAVQRALAEAADWHGYPTTLGTPALRAAIVDFLQRRRGAPTEIGPAHVLPVVGSKELVANLPAQLGLGQGDAVAFPHIAYPTYGIGAQLAGADAVPVDTERLAAEGDGALPDGAAGRVRLLWLNSPSNPTGAVLTAQQMARIVTWARERDVIVASDECYALLPWEVDDVPSILDPRVHGGDLSGLLCVYSLSKQANLAGYRAAFVAGDTDLIGELTLIRRHGGFIVPGPVQDAMTVALADDQASAAQRELYRARRERLLPALRAAGGEVPSSPAGLYLWTSFGRSTEDSVRLLAEHGILCAPGLFYGEAGEGFVRVALTATDERIDAAVERLID